MEFKVNAMIHCLTIREKHYLPLYLDEYVYKTIKRQQKCNIDLDFWNYMIKQYKLVMYLEEKSYKMNFFMQNLRNDSILKMLCWKS